MEIKLSFPKTPPEGLLAYAESIMSDCHALLYEVAWVPDTSLEAALTDRVGRKVKRVRCRCTACETEFLMPWSPTVSGYGFADMDHGAIVETGDEMDCPFCGRRVQVRKAAALGRCGYATTDEAAVTSASVVGKEHNLALTMWIVERRCYRDTTERLVARVAEAYVFSADDCQRFTAWVTTYSGTAGYYKAYRSYWTTAQRWSEDWGYENHIFGLTPELVAQSSLPNCKLDVYMDSFPDLGHHYPIAYLRLYQKHPNVESLLLHGLPLVLHELIAEETSVPAWQQRNNRGTPKLDVIHWNETRPAQMLGLTREELRQGAEMGWGTYFWRIYVGARKHGEILTRETFEAIFELGEDCLLELLGEAPIKRTVKYLQKQFGVAESCCWEYEEEFGDPSDWPLPDATMLRDYWNMCRALNLDLTDTLVRWPRNLMEAHDKISVAYQEMEDKKQQEQLAERFAQRFKALSRYSFEHDGLMIVPARTPELLKREGKMQHHCVWSYRNNHALGNTAIFFIRRTAAPDMSYYTLEFDEEHKTVRQNRGLRNCARTQEITEFEALWLAWVRAGCKRDKDGQPILPKKKVRVVA